MKRRRHGQPARCAQLDLRVIGNNWGSEQPSRTPSLGQVGLRLAFLIATHLRRDAKRAEVATQVRSLAPP